VGAGGFHQPIATCRQTRKAAPSTPSSAVPKGGGMGRKKKEEEREACSPHSFASPFPRHPRPQSDASCSTMGLRASWYKKEKIPGAEFDEVWPSTRKAAGPFSIKSPEKKGVRDGFIATTLCRAWPLSGRGAPSRIRPTIMAG